MKSRLILNLLLCLLPASSLAASPSTLPLEMESRDWSPSPLDPGSKGVTVAGNTLTLTGSFPGSFGAAYRCPQNWEGYGFLAFETKLPAGFPAGADVQVYLKDQHYYWYQAYPFHDAKGKPQPLAANQWLPVRLPIRPFNTAWQPGGHQKVWYDAWLWPREFGVRLFSQEPWTGKVEIRNLRLEGRAEGAASPGGVLFPQPNAVSVPQYEKFELTWPVDRYYSNPYDPEIVNVEAHFTAPSGQQITVPGFFYQGFERTRTAQGYEKLIPVGAPQWKIRFAPRETGVYRYSLEVTDAQDTRAASGQFTATTPKQPRGLARISPKDPHYFEWENGEYLYPAIINMRDGGDQAEAQAGTFDFDKFFPLFRDHGISVVRTWMAAWWAGIEWSPAYHSRYSGVGRYAQYNAWRLDYTFDLAAQHDLYLELTLGSHGQLRQDKYDAEWDYNPYAVENGGFLPAPYLFFSSAKAKAEMKQRYRYLAARWGYSRNLFAWDLWNEIDLSEGYNPSEVAAWHQEMAQYLRSVDQQPHLITTHIALYWNAGDELWRLPEIQYLQSDSYWKRRDVGMNESYSRRAASYPKPFVFIEYGPQTVDLPVPESTWLQEFRCGMWVSSMLPWSAPGAFWYHHEWEQYRLGDFMAGMQAFWAGEDRRGQGYRPASVGLLGSGALAVQGMQNSRSAFFYVYNYNTLGLRQPPAAPATSPQVTARLFGLQPGTYQAEFWDTLSGEVTGTAEVTTTDGRVTLPLPPVAQDLAVKLRLAPPT